jgi:glycosyltransferase involved in cell wall biosynthesis
MNKISVTIITKNEAKNIRRCLKSIQWADEIVVVDTFSSDRTVEICREFTDKVFQASWLGYGLQKNLCASKATNRWVLNLDADEVISSECAAEIQELLSGQPEFLLYRFPRKNFIADRWVRYAGWYPDLISRLYDKDRVSFSDSMVHERLIPDKIGGIISRPIFHYSFDGMEDYIERQNRYSSLYAEEKKRLNWKVNWTHLYIRPVWAFIRTYFFRQGFREGFLGVFLALAMMFYTYLKYAKTRSIQ